MQWLRRIAERMRAEAEKSSEKVARKTLRGGLRLALRRKPTEWQLCLWRCGCQPSETEIEVCRQAFGVPAEQVMTGRVVNEEWRGYFCIWPN